MSNSLFFHSKWWSQAEQGWCFIGCLCTSTWQSAFHRISSTVRRCGCVCVGAHIHFHRHVTLALAYVILLHFGNHSFPVLIFAAWLASLLFPLEIELYIPGCDYLLQLFCVLSFKLLTAASFFLIGLNALRCLSNSILKYCLPVHFNFFFTLGTRCAITVIGLRTTQSAAHHTILLHGLHP